MPLSNDFTFNPEKTVLKNIESLQKLIRSPKFTDENSYKTQDRKEAFTALFAMRMAVNATRGEKSSLKANVTQAQYEAKMTQAVNTLTASQAFNNLFNGANAYQMVQLAANGNLSTIFTRFANAGGQLQARRPQPAQPVLQQNQPVADQNLQPIQA